LFAIGNPRADWMFGTVPEEGLNGRSLAYPRGKVIGGSSAINAMISMRGQAADYDHWRELGLLGWGWDDVLPTFRAIEDHFLGESKVHGVGGGWRVEAPRVSWPILDAMRDAALQMGIQKVNDFNGGDNSGSGYFHVNQKRGRRWSSARGFLKPALRRPNLALRTNTAVEKVSVDNGRTTGVQYFVGTERRFAHARREVILMGVDYILRRRGPLMMAPSQLGIFVRSDETQQRPNLQFHVQPLSLNKELSPIFGDA
jgi:choline dehydrogenase